LLCSNTSRFRIIFIFLALALNRRSNSSIGLPGYFQRRFHLPVARRRAIAFTARGRRWRSGRDVMGPALRFLQALIL
jgi:hypothetical protein